MILKALYDYYHRSGDLPPMGFEKKEIYFIIVIDEEGNFVRIDDTRDGKTPKSYIVPRAEKRAAGIKANLLWDNVEYVLAVPKDDNDTDASNKAKQKRAAFIERCKTIADSCPDVIEFKAICEFYNKGINLVDSAENWDILLKERTRNVTFQLEHSLDLIPSIDAVKNHLASGANTELSAAQSYCLVTGKKGEPVRLTTSTSIPGSQATASLVAFQKSSGYDSYGKEQCYNAPISEEAEAAYVTALKKLTAKDSRNKTNLGSRTLLFWASNTNEASMEVEESFFSFLEGNKADNPDRNIAVIIKSLKSIWSGEKPTSEDDRFYMLGLAPNSARIAVVYWNECTVKEFAGKMLEHFNDMEIVDGRKEQKPYKGIYAMLSAVTMGGKVSDAQPNLPEAVLKSIVQGTAYPHTLFSACIRRIRAELGETGGFSITRMAILKAELNRLNDNNKKIEIMLDKENTNLGYICGRLFAVLEYTQKSANNINTIRERYMNAASATPAAVFATLLNLNLHHVEKLENEGRKVFIETLKQEIVSLIPANGFPAHLDLQDQGRFFVGYYHQLQDFYTKKSTETKE